MGQVVEAYILPLLFNFEYGPSQSYLGLSLDMAQNIYMEIYI